MNLEKKTEVDLAQQVGINPNSEKYKWYLCMEIKRLGTEISKKVGHDIKIVPKKY